MVSSTISILCTDWQELALNRMPFQNGPQSVRIQQNMLPPHPSFRHATAMVHDAPILQSGSITCIYQKYSSSFKQRTQDRSQLACTAKQVRLYSTYPCVMVMPFKQILALWRKIANVKTLVNYYLDLKQHLCMTLSLQAMQELTL